MAEHKPQRFITQLINDRVALLEVFVLSVVLSLGISLLASLFSSLPQMWALSLGAVVTLLSLGLLTVIRFRHRRSEFTVEGFLLYDQSTADLVTVPDYSLTEDITRLQRAAFAERPDLLFQWLHDPLEQRETLASSGTSRNGSSENLARRLVWEMVEYALLETLVLHTSSYFSGQGATEHLQEYDREHIPDIILSNRILDLFTSPLPIGGLPEGAEVVAVIGGNLHYLKFDLTLPAKSTVRRGSNGQIVLDNPVLTLEIQPVFEGTGSVLPPQFLERFVGVDQDAADDVHAYAVSIRISAVTKWRGILSLKGWRYQLWAEEFVERVDEKFGNERFFNRLMWPTVKALLRCIDTERRPVKDSGWAYHHFVAFGNTSNGGDLGENWRALIQDIVSTTEGDEQARGSVESALAQIAQEGEEGAALTRVLRRILAGDKSEDLLVDLGDHSKLIVRRALDALEVASEKHYREFQKRALKLVVMTIAAAQGDEEAQGALQRLA